MAYGKDMSKIYFGKSTMDLRKLRAQKIRALERARSFNTFFARRDADLLDHQLMQIDAVLESRALQQKLPL